MTSEYDADTLPLGYCDKHGVFMRWCSRCPPQYIVNRYWMVARPMIFGIPIGTICDEVDVMRVPDDVLPALVPLEGQALSMDAYPDLFRVIGNQYGGSYRERTFKVPNLLGRLKKPVVRHGV